jgi:hypothetical protein
MPEHTQRLQEAACLTLLLLLLLPPLHEVLVLSLYLGHANRLCSLAGEEEGCSGLVVSKFCISGGLQTAHECGRCT